MTATCLVQTDKDRGQAHGAMQDVDSRLSFSKSGFSQRTSTPVVLCTMSVSPICRIPVWLMFFLPLGSEPRGD